MGERIAQIRPAGSRRRCSGHGSLTSVMPPGGCPGAPGWWALGVGCSADLRRRVAPLLIALT